MIYNSVFCYRDVPLKLGLTEYSGYDGPVNRANLGENFLYFGFIPASMVRTGTRQGLRVGYCVKHVVIVTQCVLFS